MIAPLVRFHLDPNILHFVIVSLPHVLPIMNVHISQEEIIINVVRNVCHSRTIPFLMQLKLLTTLAMIKKVSYFETYELFLVCNISVACMIKLYSKSFSEKKLGQLCCANKQCLYSCGAYKESKICLCPRHLLLDATKEPYKCCKFKNLCTTL